VFIRQNLSEIIVPRRLRETDRRHVGALKAHLARHGLLEPVVVDADNVLLCGAHRLQAAKELGWEEIDCHVIEGVTDALLIEMGENALRKPYTNYELYFYIRQRWEQASEASAHRMGRRKKGEAASKRLGKTTQVIGRECGISGEQVRRIKLVGDAALADRRYEGFLEELRRIRLNRVWRRFQMRWNADRAAEGALLAQEERPSGGEQRAGVLRANGLYLGDCRELLPRLPGRSVHAVICDPPYGNGTQEGGCHDVARDPAGFGEWLRPVVAECRRVVVPGGLVAFFVASDLRYLEWCREWFGNEARLVVVVKRRNAGFAFDTPVVPSFDSVVVTFNEGAKPLTPAPKAARRDWFESCQRFDPEAKAAPFPKCLDLCEYLVEQFTVEGGVVLDPCMGSGSIPLAAARKGRGYIGVERERTFYDLARLRMAKYGDPAFDYWGALDKGTRSAPAGGGRRG
jgi:DNA methylase/ParB-like nuclease domain